MPGSRYRKTHKDLRSLDPNSQEYWEEILRREGLSMERGRYPQRLKYGWRNREGDPRNGSQGSDDYAEESIP